MNIAKIKLFHEVILKVIKKKKAELHELFKEYYMVDMYEWSTLVKKVIA